MDNRKQFRKWALALLLVPVLVLAACSRASNTPSAVTGTGAVSQVTIVDTVEATGSIQPRQVASLNWGTSGTVATVNVQNGQTVKAGDVLMSLDPATVPANVLTAQSQLNDARQTFQQVTQPTLTSISTATQALATASSTWMSSQTSLNNTFSTRSASGNSDLYSAWDTSRALLVNAEKAFPLVNASIDAQAYYVAVYTNASLNIQLKAAQQAASLNSADTLLAQKVTDLGTAVTNAQAQQDALAAGLSQDTRDKVSTLVNDLLAYQQAASGYIGSIAGDPSSVADAAKLNASLAAFQVAGQGLNDNINNLYALVRVPTQNSYTKAQAQYLAALSTADSLNLRAPFDGTVEVINNQPGDVVSNNAAGAVVIDQSMFYVNVQVDETKIVKLKAGDTATVIVEALPDLKLTGKVVSINPVGVASQGIVYYTVRVQLDQADPSILAGATVDVTIQAGEPQQALAVPVLAIQNSGTAEYVTLVAADGSTRDVQVVSGRILADDRVVVTGSLKVGDQVQLVQSTTTTSTGSGFRVGGGGGGILP